MSTAPRRRGGARSVPALYGALTAGLVAVVMVIASVVSPATPPSIAELSPSARDRIEEARHDQGIGPGEDADGSCAPGEAGCVKGDATDPNAGSGSGSAVPPPLEVAAGRRCFGDPPRQTEDPHSPPCVFEIFKGDNGGVTAPGVTATEIRVAVPIPEWDDGRLEASIEALIAHFNLRYEFYGRRLTPVFIRAEPKDDPSANRVVAEELVATRPFAVTSGFGMASNAVIHRRLADAGVLSIVHKGWESRVSSGAPAFDSDQVAEGFTWLVDPPLDTRLRAGATFVCRAFKGRPARHAGDEYSKTNTLRRFAVLVLKEQSGVRSDPGPLKDGLDRCDADFQIFETATNASDDDQRQLVLDLKLGDFTTILLVGSSLPLGVITWAQRVDYFPEWMDFGSRGAHFEGTWGWPEWSGEGRHAFGFTPEVRVRPDAEVPAMWALREAAPNLDVKAFEVEGTYRALLILASGIQGAGPNLTPETFARALRATRFPNPNPGGPPHWQQRVGFGAGDPVFDDDYALWWWNPSAPSQMSGASSSRGSFCYLNRGGRFTAEALPADADVRLFDQSEACR